MIGDCAYHCASGDTPATANMVCMQEGCTTNPFICGQGNCACYTMHREHQYKPLNELLKTLATQTKFPVGLVREEKDIGGLIDRLVFQLQSLK